MKKLNNTHFSIRGDVVGGFSFQLILRGPEPNTKKQKKLFENDLGEIAAFISNQIQISDWGKEMKDRGLLVGAYPGKFIHLIGREGSLTWKE